MRLRRFKVYVLYDNGTARRVGKYRTPEDAQWHARLVTIGMQDNLPDPRKITAVVVSRWVRP